MNRANQKTIEINYFDIVKILRRVSEEIIEFICSLFFDNFFFFLTVPFGMQNLSSPTRDPIWLPGLGGRVSITEPPGNFLIIY